VKRRIHCILTTKVFYQKIFVGYTIMVFLNTPLIQNTTQGSRPVIHMKNLAGLVENTIGSAAPKVIAGVLTETARGMPSKSKIPVIHSKTQPMTQGQVPYAGPKY
jgi:hypothetical protein